MYLIGKKNAPEGAFLWLRDCRAAQLAALVLALTLLYFIILQVHVWRVRVEQPGRRCGLLRPPTPSPDHQKFTSGERSDFI